MTALGQTSVGLAFLLSLYVIAATALGYRLHSQRLLESARQAVLALAAVLTAAVALLLQALVANDFSLSYVAQESDRALPLLYKVTALWGGNAGSLLFWVWVLAGYAAVLNLRREGEGRLYIPLASAVIAANAAFFTGLITFVTPVFAPLAAVPDDGRGLNPLLQNAYMAVHPPLLYAGYVGFTVPFAFAMAALLLRDGSDAWIRITRRWALVAFTFLSLGIIAGAHWSYTQLGWGGYWSWDPVENASLLPWLTGTAFLHSVMIQEKRGMFKVWNIILISATFLLTLVGTFLTRTGVVLSVHAFANGSTGLYLLGFIGLVVVGVLYLILDRAPLLRDERPLESVVSKEASFLFNNLLMLGAAATVLFGTLFPLISRSLTGRMITLGPPYYNRVMVPIALAILVLMGVGPLIAWRRATLSNLGKNFLWPFGTGVVLAALAFAGGVRQLGPLLAVLATSFVAATVVWEVGRAAWVRRQLTGEALWPGLWRLLARNRRRYGGYLVHLALLLMMLGFTGSSAYATKKQIDLRVGETTRVGAYQVTYLGAQQSDGPDIREARGAVALAVDGKPAGQLYPALQLFKKFNQPQSVVAVRSTWREDLYVVIAAVAGDQASFLIEVNPLVSWIWFGAEVLLLGSIFSLWPEARPEWQRAQERQAQPSSGPIIEAGTD